ncbi:MAG: endonuclease/exonuclease/phosphatase family protein [Deltaproteobacteria bacterium]|nr:endonuclease/exonuclease/phosphatase family protein [Deltaproteobacteria bacterium]
MGFNKLLVRSGFFLGVLAPIIFTVFLVYSNSSSDRTVGLMEYNVENLFDATDDGPEQKDVAFLPASIKTKQWKNEHCKGQQGFFYELCANLDWTQDKYEKKLSHIAQVILGHDQEYGADIIVLEELENKRVMEDLWQLFLKDKGYLEPIHSESPGFRGIDVGIISRFPLSSPAIVHPVLLNDQGAYSRDVLEARFKVSPDIELRVAANHWPSPASKTSARLKAAAVLRKAIDQASLDGAYFVAMGDFNTLSEERPNPISDYLADSNMKDMSTYPMVDMHLLIAQILHFMKGTHYYRGTWDHLDRVLLSKNFFQKDSLLQPIIDSFTILHKDFLLMDAHDGRATEKIPYRYDFFRAEGYSDHLPIALQLLLKAQ